MSSTARVEIVLRSPNKSDNCITVPIPFKVKDICDAAADSSWDVANIFLTEDDNKITRVAQRPRPAERPAARKQTIINLSSDMEDIRAMVNDLKVAAFEERTRNDLLHRQLLESQEALLLSQAESIARLESILQKDAVVERHEALALAVQGLNDIIFDTRRKKTVASAPSMTSEAKKLLKANGLRYITHLLNPPLKNPDGEDLSDEVHGARIAALSILSAEQLSLATALVDKLLKEKQVRNAAQHPKPDRQTTLARTVDLKRKDHDALRDFLATDPKRLPLREDGPATDLHLFCRDGDYVSVDNRWKGLEKKKQERVVGVARVEALKAAEVELAKSRGAGAGTGGGAR
ncbi:hypothetical protein B0H14DRAFT_3030858 [Mycena olivaceomarginata]|nr:hypothetical protein B0H14DRAFT_3030858 [Mycena olivaceomarginata]